jgi:glycine/D-amino acid oxidase-like deaminating enzyme
MHYDAIIVGGGIYGCFIALRLAQTRRIMLIEREPHLLARASYHNQARVHGGYHYPRSLLTALRSRTNAPRFLHLFKEAICCEFEHYYAIGRRRSNVTAQQFAQFCRRIGADIAPAPSGVERLFREDLIEAVFGVREFVFDAVKLRDCLEVRLREAGVEVCTRREVLRIDSDANGYLLARIRDVASQSMVEAGCTTLYNCTYSRLNELLARSGLETLRLTHEATETALVEVPAALQGRCVTVMCGPFFSLVPFPPLNLVALTHVTYTPHYAWTEDPGKTHVAPHVPTFPLPSRFDRMQRDAARYLPALRACTYTRSLWEVKTLLPQSSVNDSRPILFRRDRSNANVISILGGKVDNIFDLEELLGDADRSAA